MKFFVELGKGYPKTSCLSHDEHVICSEIENSYLNRQCVGRKQSDVENSFSRCRFFDNNHSNAHMGPIV